MKQTEIGLIPEDWEVKELNYLSNKIASGKSNTRNDSNGIYPIYGSTGIIGFKSYFDYEGDKITVARVGANAGTLNLIKGNYCISDNTLFVEIKKEFCLKFVYRYLESINLNKYIFGSGQPLITGSILKNLQIPLPPLAEQEAIANALSDADAWIEKLEQLIAKKRLIKQGAMQTLLTPKEDWEVKKLGEVCEIKRGQIITSSIRVDGNIPVIAGGKTPAYYHNKSNRKGKTITISASGASAGYVGFHNYPIFASDCSTISESEKYSIEFIFYFLQRNQDVIYSYQTGGAQPHIHPKDIEPMLIGIPSLSEQERIATILSDMDAEIEALEQQLGKARHIKQGMMQELLTGKVRLLSEL